MVTRSGLCATCEQGDHETVPVPDPPRGTFGPTRTADDPLGPTATAGFPDGSNPAPRVVRNPPAGYVLQGELGHGAMGYVVKAFETDSERTVAIKFLRDRLSTAASGRFRTEVQSLAKVRHPNVVSILAVNLAHDDPYFTMEYESGGTLAAAIKERTRFRPAEAVGLVEQLARGLAAIHAAGVLHRDVKPQNVLLAGDGTPKLADLGLAKQTDKGDDHTHTGAMIGTLNYMAPEQAGRKRSQIDARTDVYELGAVLYQCLTGKPPFQGHDSHDIVRKILTERPPPLRTQYPDIPKDLEAVCLKCLEKDPADRYQTAAALADDLARVKAGQPTVARPLSFFRATVLRKSRARSIVGRVLAVILLLAAGIWGLNAAGVFAPRPKSESRQQAEYDERIREGLKSGAVTLIGESGLPRYRAFRMGTAVLEERWPDRACTFEIIQQALVELCSNPGIDAYAFTADLQLERSKLETPAGGVPSVGGSALLGLYVNYQGYRTDDVNAHTFVALPFNDFDPVAAADSAVVQLRSVALVQTPGNAEPHNPTVNIGPRHRFTGVNRMPGEVRRLKIVVTPDGIEALFAPAPGAGFVTVTKTPAAEIRRKVTEQVAAINALNRFPQIPVPTWNPRSPIGLWVRNAGIAVKNCVVEPVPIIPGG